LLKGHVEEFEFKRREAMREQARRAMTRGAIALALWVLIPIDAGAYPFDRYVITTNVAEQDSKTDGRAGATVEPDPTGSIIVECVALAAVLNANQLQGISNTSLATVPQNPLGPLKCWPNDNRRIQ
jgi:hypothetical protein